MLLNNKKNASFFAYQIMFNPTDKKWYAWYICDISEPQNREDPLIIEASKALKESSE